MFKNKIEIDNEAYNLVYNVSISDEGCFVLSVTKGCNGTIVDKSRVTLAPLTFDSVVEMAKIMCRNTVTPMSLRDVVEDMLFSRVVVE